MGLFKNLRQQVQAATQMAAEIRAATPPGVPGAPAVQAAPGVPPPPPPPPPPTAGILNPTPQAEVDRLLQAGGVVRGVVTGSRHDMTDGNRSVRTRVHVRVRPRLPQGGLGPEAAVTAWVNWKVAVLLEPGLEVPVELDRSTGSITGLATGQLADELAPRGKEAKQRHRGFDVDTGLEGITAAPAVLREVFAAPAPTMPADGGLGVGHPLLAPIEGVSLDVVVEVQALLRVTGMPLTQYDSAAQAHGVPAGRWSAIEGEWMMRTWTNPALAQRWGTSLEQAEARHRGRR